MKKKFEQLLSSGFVCPKSMWKYRKVAPLPHQRLLKEKASLKANCTPFNKAHSLKSLGANMACDEVNQETRKTCVVTQG